MTSDVSPPLSVAARFWWGAVLPAAALALFVAVLLATGEGRREAPLIVFFASLFAVPSIVLLNGWTLFVGWRARARLIAAALVLPVLFASGATLFVHGSGRWQEAGMVALAPFLMVPMRGVGILVAVWAVVVLSMLWAAHRFARRNR